MLVLLARQDVLSAFYGQYGKVVKVLVAHSKAGCSKAPRESAGRYTSYQMPCHSQQLYLTAESAWGSCSIAKSMAAC